MILKKKYYSNNINKNIVAIISSNIIVSHPVFRLIVRSVLYQVLL